MAIVFINVTDVMLVLQCMHNTPYSCWCYSIADYWISVEVQSRNTAVILSTVVTVSPTDAFGSLLNDKVSIPAETQIEKICNNCKLIIFTAIM